MYGIESIAQMLKQYFAGNALLVIAVIALLHWGKKSVARKKYIICVIVLLAVLLNDLVFQFVIKIGESGTFYRVLWILPVPLFAAYLIIELWDGLSGWKRCVFVVLALGFLLANAVPDWNNWGKIPSNIYQMDEEVIAIADMIEEHSGGKRVNIIDDYSISWYIREYNDNLCDPGAEDYYLRLIISEQSLAFKKADIENAAVIAKIDYIILQKNKLGANETLSNAGFELIGSSDNYNIYYTDRTALEAGRS